MANRPVVIREVTWAGVTGFDRLLQQRDERVRQVLPFEVGSPASAEVVSDIGTV